MTQDTIEQLSKEEQALLNPFDFVACMHAIEESKKVGQISPTWLSLREELREEARSAVLVMFRIGLGNLDISRAEIEEMVAAKQRVTYEAWVAAETEFKAMRPTNPRAFFAEYAG